MLPLARTEGDGLIIKPLDGETVIFDMKSRRALCLNLAATLLLRRSDGETSIAQMTAALREELHLDADEAAVWAGLETLNREGLLSACPEPPHGFTASTRRRLRRKLVTAIGTAFISSIIVPAAAMAASLTCVMNATGCGGFHATCTKNTNCCSCNCNTSAGKCM